MRKGTLLKLLYASCAMALAAGANAAQVLAPDDDEPDLVPTGKGWGERATPTPGFVTHGNNGNGQAGKPGSGSSNNGINYHGGPVMLGTTNVYYIWYGNWASNSANDDSDQPRAIASAGRLTTTSTRRTTTGQTCTSRTRFTTPAPSTTVIHRERRSPMRRSERSSPTRSRPANCRRTRTRCTLY